jgi:hypothetical protein
MNNVFIMSFLWPRVLVVSRPDEVNFFHFTKSFRPNQALGFTQSLTKVVTRSRKITFLGSRARPVRRADSLTVMRPDYLNNVGSLRIHNPVDFHTL